MGTGSPLVVDGVLQHHGEVLLAVDGVPQHHGEALLALDGVGEQFRSCWKIVLRMGLQRLLEL